MHVYFHADDYDFICNNNCFINIVSRAPPAYTFRNSGCTPSATDVLVNLYPVVRWHLQRGLCTLGFPFFYRDHGAVCVSMQPAIAEATRNTSRMYSKGLLDDAYFLGGFCFLLGPSRPHGCARACLFPSLGRFCRAHGFVMACFVCTV